MTNGSNAHVEAGAGGVSVIEAYLTPKEISEAWRVSENTVRRVFADVPGVLKLGRKSRGTRGYETLRVPVPIYRRICEERSR